MKEIPKGFKKMDLILSFENRLTEIVEMKIIHFLVRDFYLFYSKIPKTGNTMTEFHFYCQPKQETAIAYRLGCYAQTLIGFHTKKGFENPLHSVADNFPECVEIPAFYNKNHQLCVGNRLFDNGEAQHEVSVKIYVQGT